MKKKDNKQFLYEMMEKINPDFKQTLDEKVIIEQSIQAGSAIQPKQSSDAAMAAKMATQSSPMRYAQSKIDTPQEFQDAFQNWMSTTGFNPQKKPLSISQAQTLIKNAMLKLGYK